MTTVWIKLEGPLSEVLDPPSRWAIGEKQSHADDVIETAKLAGDSVELVVYAEAAISIKGQRAVQRWLVSHGIDAWATHIQEPPEGAEVISEWPMSTTSNSDPAVSPPKPS